MRMTRVNTYRRGNRRHRVCPAVGGDGRPRRTPKSGSVSAAMSVTRQLVDTAATRGDDDALIGAGDGRRHTYASLASTVTRAAAGLAWRGLRPHDVVGVYVGDVACF